MLYALHYGMAGVVHFGMYRNYYVNTIFQPRHSYRNTIFKLSALIYMNIHFPFLHIYQ